MRLAVFAHREPISIDATGSPPRDRTSRVSKALELCRSEWSNAYDLAISKGKTSQQATRMAGVAYKLAMPKMEGLPAIQAAIATIAQGIQLEVFDGRDGSQLLYAAQVAMALHKQKEARKQ